MKKVIIHTNKYAGNFEREMCAYITGHIGDCGVGSNLVDEKYTPMFEPYILQIDEENTGCKRPVKIYPNPRYANNGLGHSFDSSSLNECKEAQQHHIDYIKNDKLKKLYETLEFYKGTRADVSYTKEQIESVEKEISDYASIPPLEIPSYPSYHSVCIYFKDNIPKNLLEIVVERANNFHTTTSRLGRSKEDLIIEGFEFISETESDCDFEVISKTEDIINGTVKVTSSNILVCKKMCGDCPFSKTSMQGFLADYTIEDFVAYQRTSTSFPCHKMMGSGDMSPEETHNAIEKGEMKLCRGYVESIIKSCKKPDTEILTKAVEFVREDGLSDNSMSIFEFREFHNREKVE